MDSLELKHIAPYLPYGVNFKYDRPGGITDTITSLYDIDEDDTIKLKIGYSDAEHIWMFKPILRPMTDITKVIIHNGDVFRPICKLLESYCFDTDKMEESEILSYSESLIEIDMSLQTATMLCEWHFDIFGLIDMGLAIGINTYHS